MPAKRCPSAVAGAGLASLPEARKVCKVSSNRQDAAILSLQMEVHGQRLEEQVKLIIDECRLDPGCLDSCYCISIKSSKKRDSSNNLHRNMIVVSHIAAKNKLDVSQPLAVFCDEAWDSIVADKEIVHEVYCWFNDYSPQTEIGVTAIPVENWKNITLSNIRRNADFDRIRACFRGCRRVCPQYLHGHFGFWPAEDTAKKDITQVVHHESATILNLPFGIAIPRSQVAPPCGVFVIGEDQTVKKTEEFFHFARWGCAETCVLRGPGGLNLSMYKLFDDRCDLPRAAKCMIQSHADMTMATAPSPLAPDVVLTVRKGVLEYIAQVAEGRPIPATPVAARRALAGSSPASSSSPASLASSDSPLISRMSGALAAEAFHTRLCN